MKVLGDVRASDTRADFLRALKFCADALQGRENPLLILIGDGAYPEHLLSLVRLDRRSGDPRAKDRRPRARGDTPSTPRSGNARTAGASVPRKTPRRSTRCPSRASRTREPKTR